MENGYQNFFNKSMRSFLMRRSKQSKLYSELSSLYPQLFSSKTLMVGQLGEYPPHPFLATFSKISGRPKVIYLFELFVNSPFGLCRLFILIEIVPGTCLTCDFSRVCKTMPLH